MPEYDTENTKLRKFFGRDTHFTTIFHTGKFVLWMIIVISGFVFVNLVNLMNQRRNPFKGRDGSYRDFIILVISSIFIYFITPLIALRARHDMQRDFKFGSPWKNDLPEENQYPGCKGNLNCIEPYPVLPALPSFLRFIIREISFAFYTIGFPFSSNCCYVYTDYEIVAHNMIFIASFCLGMNYTHLDFPPFSQFGFTKHQVKNFNWVGWLLTIIFTLFILGNAYYVYYAHQFSLSHERYVYLTVILLGYGIIRTL